MNIYDLVIIGGGPIGLACALEAEKKKLSYVILEKAQ
jgi:thioredoxin reductase (NADPH)